MYMRGRGREGSRAEGSLFPLVVFPAGGVSYNDIFFVFRTSWFVEGKREGSCVRWRKGERGAEGRTMPALGKERNGLSLKSPDGKERKEH